MRDDSANWEECLWGPTTKKVVITSLIGKEDTINETLYQRMFAN